MGDRIKLLRAILGLTQQKFADRLKIKGNAISQYESGRNKPIDAVVSLICREFNVNEEWLRTGDGEMFREATDDPLDALVRDYGLTACERAVLESYLGLGAENRRVVMTYLQQVAALLSGTPTTVPVGGAFRVLEEVEPHAAPRKPAIPNGMVELKVYDQPAAAGLGNDLDEPNYHLKLFPAHLVPPGTNFGVLIDGDSMEPTLHDGYTAFVQATQMVEDGEVGVFFLNGKAYIKGLSNDPIRQRTQLISLNPAYKPIVIQEYDNFRPLGLVLGQHKTDN